MTTARVVTVGGATRDVFLAGPGLEARIRHRGRAAAYELDLGEKLEVERVAMDVGGGAANVAVSMARQGLQAAFVGKVGDDRPGHDVLDLLAAEGVDCSAALGDPKAATNLSTILLSESGERTILAFRGATKRLRRADVDPAAIHGDWLYVTSLAGRIELLEHLVDLAHAKGMAVAIDPGKAELAHPERMRRLLGRVELLKANRAELALLSGIEDLEASARALAELGPTVVGTDGEAGALAVSADEVVEVPGPTAHDARDRTGAGDAFGAGLVGALARGGTLRQALGFANRNATACVRKVGATSGLLRVRG